VASPAGVGAAAAGAAGASADPDVFDIRTELSEIRAILEADDDAEGSEEEEP
jgi:hypothetical protein